MGGDSDEDTQVSDAVAELAAEPTQLADAVETTDSEAWSLCDEEPEARVRPWWITGAAVAASLAVVGAAAWIAVPHLRGGEPAPAPPSPVAAPVTTTTVAKAAPPPPPPPPVTVTTVVVQSTVQVPAAAPDGPVTIPAVLPNPLPPLTATDRLFLSRLQGQGWWVGNAQLMSYRAWETCAMLHNGEPLTAVQMKLLQLQGEMDFGNNGVGARQFIDTAMATYANCP